MASFTLIVVSWNPDNVTLLGEGARLIGILVAGIAGILICIFVFPVWAGQDLHVGTADNIDRLARYLEGNRSFLMKFKCFIDLIIICFSLY